VVSLMPRTRLTNILYVALTPSLSFCNCCPPPSVNSLALPARPDQWAQPDPSAMEAPRPQIAQHLSGTTACRGNSSP
jgi:hypothetical protein